MKKLKAGDLVKYQLELHHRGWYYEVLEAGTICMVIATQHDLDGYFEVIHAHGTIVVHGDFIAKM